jgi:hypothetical protein
MVDGGWWMVNGGSSMLRSEQVLVLGLFSKICTTKARSSRRTKDKGQSSKNSQEETQESKTQDTRPEAAGRKVGEGQSSKNSRAPRGALSDFSIRVPAYRCDAGSAFSGARQDGMSSCC